MSILAPKEMRHHQWDVTDEMEFRMVQRRLHPGAGCQGQGAKGHTDCSTHSPKQNGFIVKQPKKNLFFVFF